MGTVVKSCEQCVPEQRSSSEVYMYYNQFYLFYLILIIVNTRFCSFIRSSFKPDMVTDYRGHLCNLFFLSDKSSYLGMHAIDLDACYAHSWELDPDHATNCLSTTCTMLGHSGEANMWMSYVSVVRISP